MGLRDKIKSGMRAMWSPITVWMADQGSDQLVTAGGPAKVVIDVRGQDDGTAERVEVFLKMTVFDHIQKWPLGEVPAVLGQHTLEVTMPTGLAPSCAGFAEYTFNAELHRSKGVGSSAASVVDVVSRPEDTYWPSTPRSGQEGDDAARITIELDSPLVNAGALVSGRVTIHALRPIDPASVDLAVGPSIGPPPQTDAKFSGVARVRLAHDVALGTAQPLVLPFAVQVPAAAPPTLYNGGKVSVVWAVRVEFGRTTGWALVGVLDPTGAAGVRNQPSPSLLGFLASLDTSGPGR
ncbi:MAG: hypothetical protein JWN20_1930 [Jatrophihabitantaceae bacterium]|nr:hypothetical protein [Jatrophihabitantaceae bacterium]